MRGLLRNKQGFYYLLFKKKEKVLDESGRYSGQQRIFYEPPVYLAANISPASGAAVVELFGNQEQYDKIIVIDDPNVPIDSTTVLFIDSEPEFDAAGNPKYNYVVRRTSKSLNSLAIAVTRVEVS